MNAALKRLPSFGFLFFLASWLVLAAFLWWGFSQPDLDRVWLITQRMEQEDFSGLDEEEADVVARSVKRHPQLARAFAGGRKLVGLVEPTRQGWTRLSHFHIVVHTKQPTPIRVWADCRGHQEAYPVTLSFEDGSLRQQLEFRKDGRQSFDLPADLVKKPLLVRARVRTNPSASSAEAEPFEVRITGEALDAGGRPK